MFLSELVLHQTADQAVLHLDNWISNHSLEFNFSLRFLNLKLQGSLKLTISS